MRLCLTELNSAAKSVVKITSRRTDRQLLFPGPELESIRTGYRRSIAMDLRYFGLY